MTDTLHCSFCGKSQHEVRKLIAGPSTYICDECVALCNDIIDSELERQRRGVGLFEQLGRAIDARAARKRQSRDAAKIARQAPVEQRRVDAAVRDERDRCSSIIEGEVARLERSAGPLLGWSVTQAKLRVLRHMVDLIRNPQSPAPERQQ